MPGSGAAVVISHGGVPSSTFLQIDDPSSWFVVSKPLSDTLHIWRERYQQRANWRSGPSATFSIGLSWSDVAFEAEKPELRA
jgi:hypothetical protein